VRSRRLGLRLFECSGAARTLLLLAIVAGFGAAVMVVGQAWLLSVVISHVVIDHETLRDVRWLLTLILFTAVVRGVLVYWADVLAQRAASDVKGHSRNAVMERLLSLGPLFARGERSGELVHVAAQGIEDLDEYITLYIPQRVLAICVPALVAIVVLAIDPLT